jgi:hypothetical protein
VVHFIGTFLLVGWMQLGGSLGQVEGIVQAPGKRVTNAVVYLVPMTDTTYMPPTEPPIIDQRRLRFVPNIQVVAPGTTVEFRNSDPVLHNVFSPNTSSEGFNLGTYPKSQSRSFTFTSLGGHVILCHVHPEMVAYVVVIPTPYYGVVDSDGRFRIDGVPPGPYALRVWHRRLESPERVVTVPEGRPLTLSVDLVP